ncbi:MAG: heparan-alpha-glucosaminide N-acetyltransferase domain-containing protein [Bacteroidota bacterium]
MKQRIHSIDIIRGLIMIIMALDHSRDFFHHPGLSPTNLQTTTVILFFTRFITHFCAPGFIFLSGVSVFLTGERRTKKELSSLLFKRGLWLILSDMLIISLLFTFDLQYHILVLEVLWATGFGMILLALLIRTSLPAIAAIAVIILFGHDLLNYVTLPNNGFGGSLLTLLVSPFRGMVQIGDGRFIAGLYAAIPWSGAILLGYVFGKLYQNGFDGKKRQKTLLISGIFFICLFFLLRSINHYGDPRPWTIQRNFAHTVLSYLNVTKQVPSLLFFSITLGPILVLLSMIEKTSNRFTAVCRVYGNVPYFYFIGHFCLLRVINIVLIFIEGIPMKSSSDLPLVWQATGFVGYPLWAVYLFWIAVVALMYYPCKWYGNYKRTYGHWWLTYV